MPCSFNLPSSSFQLLLLGRQPLIASWISYLVLPGSPPYVVLSRCEIQSVLLGQLPADLGVADLDVPVRYGLPVVPDPVVDQMAVRMGLVEMAHQ